jgi:hypothetical protein
MKRYKIFFLIVLPVLWMTTSLLSFLFPGDEYAMYAIGSFAGTWINMIFNFRDIHNPLIPVSIAITGGIIMMAFGYIMDRLRIREMLWSILFMMSSVTIFVLSIKSFPNVKRALAKNGSWWAFIFFSICFGIYPSVLLSLLVGGFQWGRDRFIKQQITHKWSEG